MLALCSPTPRPVRSDFDMKAKASLRSFFLPQSPLGLELRLGTSESPQHRCLLVGRARAGPGGLPPILEGSLWGGGPGSQGRSRHSSQATRVHCPAHTHACRELPRPLHTVPCDALNPWITRQTPFCRELRGSLCTGPSSVLNPWTSGPALPSPTAGAVF